MARNICSPMLGLIWIFIIRETQLILTAWFGAVCSVALYHSAITKPISSITVWNAPSSISARASGLLPIQAVAKTRRVSRTVFRTVSRQFAHLSGRFLLATPTKIITFSVFRRSDLKVTFLSAVPAFNLRITPLFFGDK